MLKQYNNYCSDIAYPKLAQWTPKQNVRLNQIYVPKNFTLSNMVSSYLRLQSYNFIANS